MLCHRSMRKVRPSILRSGRNCRSAPLTAAAAGMSTRRIKPTPSNTYAATSLINRSSPPVTRQTAPTNDPLIRSRTAELEPTEGNLLGIPLTGISSPRFLLDDPSAGHFTRLLGRVSQSLAASRERNLHCDTASRRLAPTESARKVTKGRSGVMAQADVWRLSSRVSNR
jgi:hypothetical protein